MTEGCDVRTMMTEPVFKPCSLGHLSRTIIANSDGYVKTYSYNSRVHGSLGWYIRGHVATRTLFIRPIGFRGYILLTLVYHWPPTCTHEIWVEFHRHVTLRQWRR